MAELTYLSIDLDYWMRSDPDEVVAFFERVFGNGFWQGKVDVPLVFVRDHKQLWSHVNRSPANRLRQVDYHADLSDDRYMGFVLDINWAGMVDWRERGDFVWHYPDEECYDHGNGFGRCWQFRCNDPFNMEEELTRDVIAARRSLRFKGWGWNTIDKELGVDSIDPATVVAAGVAESPHNTNYNAVRHVLPALERHRA